MKKLILSFLYTALSFSYATAQYIHETHLGLEIGLNKSSFSETGGQPNLSYNSLYGLRIGAILDYSANDYVSIQPGILFSMMGANQPQFDYTGGISPNTDIRLNYLHIPINILCKLNAANGKFFFGGGPYLSFGVKGEVKTDDVTYDSLIYKGGTHGLIFGSTPDKIALLELGINLNAGYEFKNGLFFRVGYNYGLKPIENSGSVADRNTCIYISLGGLVKLR